MRQILQDETLQKRFEEKGYACFPLLSDEDVEYILDQLATLRPDDKFAPDGNNRLGNTYHCSFLDSNVDYKRKTNALIARIFTPYIEKHLSGFRVLNGNFYVKPPHTGEFAIHQNWPALADLSDTTVTLWCPLVDVEASNGALQVAEGSHKIVQHVEGPNAPGYFTPFKKELIEKYLTPLPMKAGECVVFDDGLIHWSAKNEAEHPRIAIQILCVPKDAQPVYLFLDHKQPGHFEVIEADTEFFFETPLSDLMTRQPHWKSLGFIENRNRYLTEEEFVEMVKNGDEVRRTLPLAAPLLPERPAPVVAAPAPAGTPAPAESPAAPKEPSLLSRLFGGKK